MGVPAEWCYVTVLTMCQLLFVLGWCSKGSTLRTQPRGSGGSRVEFWHSLATCIYGAVAIMGGGFSLLGALPFGIPFWANASATGLWFLSSFIAMRAWRHTE